MYLEGQDETTSHNEQAGYAMAALIVGLAVMAVLMTVAMPVWKQMAQREKEAELVFRGEQYARAIGLFQRKFGNTYPPSLDVLVQGKFLRKKYKDPITNDDFAPLNQVPAAGQRGARAGSPPTGPAGRGAGGRIGTDLAALEAAATGRGAGVGGIIGVTSKSTDSSIRLYKGRSHYNEWAFVYVAPVLAPGGARGAGAPGQRGNQRGGGQPMPGPLGGIGGRGGPPGRGPQPFPFPAPPPPPPAPGSRGR